MALNQINLKTLTEDRKYRIRKMAEREGVTLNNNEDLVNYAIKKLADGK